MSRALRGGKDEEILNSGAPSGGNAGAPGRTHRAGESFDQHDDDGEVHAEDGNEDEVGDDEEVVEEAAPPSQEVDNDAGGTRQTVVEEVTAVRQPNEKAGSDPGFFISSFLLLSLGGSG
jgi:hypothetical protein